MLLIVTMQLRVDKKLVEATVVVYYNVAVKEVIMSDVIFILILLSRILGLVIGGYIVYLIIKALQKYIRQKEIKQQNNIELMNLAQRIKEKRTQAHMTQEFVAESLGVSRQAVSKWENGTSDPSTRNLLELAGLFKVDVKELLG